MNTSEKAKQLKREAKLREEEFEIKRLQQKEKRRLRDSKRDRAAEAEERFRFREEFAASQQRTTNESTRLSLQNEIRHLMGLDKV